MVEGEATAVRVAREALEVKMEACRAGSIRSNRNQTARKLGK